MPLLKCWWWAEPDLNWRPFDYQSNAQAELSYRPTFFDVTQLILCGFIRITLNVFRVNINIICVCVEPLRTPIEMHLHTAPMPNHFQANINNLWSSKFSRKPFPKPKTSATEFAPVAAVKVVFIAVKEAANVMTAGKTLRAPLARVLL